MDLATAEPVITPSQSTPEPSPAPVTTTTETTPSPTTTTAPEAKPTETTAVVTGEEKKPEYKSGGDIKEHLKNVLKYNEAHPEKTGETKPEVKVEPEVKTEPVVEKTPEEKAAEAKATEEAEKAKAAEANPFDKSGPLPAEKLAAKFAENKALSDMLAAETIKLDDGREVNLRDGYLEVARVAAQGTPLIELFPTLESAQEADKSSKTYFSLETTFIGQGDPAKGRDNFNSFMTQMQELSYLRDDQGNPIPNPELPGAFKTDGSLDAHVQHTVDSEFEAVDYIAGLLGKNENTKEYGEDLAAAVKFINDFRKNGYKMPGASSGEKPVIPAEVQARLDKADARDRELNARESTQQKQQHDAFEDKVTDATFEQITPMIENIIGETSLSDYEKKTVAEKVWGDISEKLGQNAVFKRGIEQMMSRRELSDAVRQRRVAHNLSYMKSILGGILDKRLQEAGGKRFQANQERDKKIATQIEQSKMEPKTGATVATPQNATLSGDDLHKKAVEQARTKNGGREPNAQQVLAETLALKRILQQSA